MREVVQRSVVVETLEGVLQDLESYVCCGRGRRLAVEQAGPAGRSRLLALQAAMRGNAVGDKRSGEKGEPHAGAGGRAA